MLVYLHANNDICRTHCTPSRAAALLQVAKRERHSSRIMASSAVTSYINLEAAPYEVFLITANHTTFTIQMRLCMAPG